MFATASTLKVGTNSITAMSGSSKTSHCCRYVLDGFDGAFRYLSSVNAIGRRGLQKVGASVSAFAV